MSGWVGRLGTLEVRFVDREAELASLLRDLTTPTVDVAVIYGPKGCGKTELLRATSSRPPAEDLYVAYADLQGGAMDALVPGAAHGSPSRTW